MKYLKKVMLVITIGFYHLSFAQPLDSLLQLVVENNPELKSLQLEFEAELMKADQVSQLADPQLGVGLPVLRPETRLGPQVMMVSASQMFPWFGTLKAKEDVVISMSKVKFERIEAVRLALYNKVRISYYKLQFLTEKEPILSNVMEQLKAMKSVTLSKIEAGLTSTASVLRVQLKIDELEQMIAKIGKEKEKEYAVINGLTQQPWITKVIPELSADFPILTFDLEAYKAKINSGYPMMKMLEEQKQVSQNRLVVNQKMGSPKIGFGIDYALVNERTDMVPLYNGRDILVPKIMLSVPIYRKAYQAKEQEELLIQESLDFAKDQLESDLVTQLLQFISDYDNALLDFNLAEQQTETSQLAYNILLIDYSSDGRGFDDLLQVQMELLSYQLNREKSKLVARIAESRIERLTDY